MSAIRCSPGISRRDALRAGLGFGSLAFNRHVAARGVGPIRHRRPSTLSAEGQERHLAVHAGRREPSGELRPQAGSRRARRQTIAETPFSGVNDPDKLKRVRVVVVNDANGQQRNTLYPTQIGFQQYGESGIPVSDWFPHIGGCVDDIAIVRSMWTTDDNHGAQVQFHSGRHMLDGRHPTIGAWTTWGLGSLNDNLPQFITMGPRFFDTRDAHYLGPAYDAVPAQNQSRKPAPLRPARTRPLAA